MYKPIIEDIEVTDWTTPINEDPTKQFAKVVLYLNGGDYPDKIDESNNYSFGYFIPVEISIDATDEQRNKALRDAADKLLVDFDIGEAAKKNDYAGGLDFLRPLSLVGMTKPWA